MKITTKRLILRDLKKSDAKDLQSNANNINISKFIPSMPFPYTLKKARDFINTGIQISKKKPRTTYEFCIELKSEENIIGMISITRIDRFRGAGTVVYWIGENYWRQGYAQESLKAIIPFFFNRLRLRRIDIAAFSDNKASNDLIKKMGFVYEGTRIKFSKNEATGKLHDLNIYGILRENWKSK